MGSLGFFSSCVWTWGTPGVSSGKSDLLSRYEGHLGVPLERDQGVGELLESHQGCQVFTLEV